MKSTNRILFLLLFVSLYLSAQAQKQGISGVFLKKAGKAYAEMQYSDALGYYKKVFKLSAKSSTTGPLSGQVRNIATKGVADCYWLLRNFDSAFVWYAKLPMDYPDADGKIRYRKAELHAINGNYKQASAELSALKGYEERAAAFLTTKKMLIDSADWSLKFLENINTNYFREFSPLVIDTSIFWATNQPSKFNRNLIMGWDNMGYSRLLQLKNSQQAKLITLPEERKLFREKTQHTNSPDFLAIHFPGADVAQFKDVQLPKSLYTKIRRIDSLTTAVKGLENFTFNLAHVTYNVNTGKAYFSANRQGVLNNEIRTVHIVEADQKDGAFTNAKFIFGITNKFSSMHPAINPAGDILVFSSNMEGGKGGYDLYYTTRSADGSWSDPLPVQGANTAGNELFASFSPDGSLYFSSDAMKGLGGLDVHRSTFSKGRVSGIVHLSYPLNSSFDDFGLTFNGNGKSGYFTTDRYGSDDILSFVFEEVYIKISGTVVSMATQKGKPGVKTVLYLIDDKGSKVAIDSIPTDDSGNYLYRGRPNREYSVSIFDTKDPEVKKIDFNSNNVFDKKNLGSVYVNDREPEKKLPPPVKVKPVVEQIADTILYIVYFDFDKYAIKQDAISTLEDVKSKLEEDPGYKVTLWGHADQSGKDNYNEKLSIARTSAVLSYLKKLGVDGTRIRIASFGETRPVIDGATEKQARFNRRVEISIRKQ